MMSTMSVLPETLMSSLVTTWMGLVLVAFGLAMRVPVTITSSPAASFGVGSAGGGDCANADAAAAPRMEEQKSRPARWRSISSLQASSLSGTVAFDARMRAGYVTQKIVRGNRAS